MSQAEADVRKAQSDFDRHSEVARLLLQGLGTAQVSWFSCSVDRIVGMAWLRLLQSLCIMLRFGSLNAESYSKTNKFAMLSAEASVTCYIIFQQSAVQS